MRKTTSKKLTCLVLSLLMCASALPMTVLAAEEQAATQKTTLQEISESFKTISYADYMEEHEGAERGSATVTVDATDYIADQTDAEVEVVSNYEGETGKALKISDYGKVTWSIDVPKAGMYAVRLTFCSTSDKTNSIERTLMINDAVPFSEARYLLMKKTWVNQYTENENGELRFEKDANGNELRPTSVVVPEWKEYVFIDS
ncbi:MAG: hypothetical protein IKI93_06215, partial [Clostridia bacterium]|nr:hypothetical protein [Clostridia bacterium]